MKVYFGCSIRNLIKYKPYYDAIRSTILNSGNVIVRDWYPRIVEIQSKNTEEKLEASFYSEVMEAILKSDLTIFECSITSMSIGHQVSFALDKQKPTLILINGEEQKVKKLFISGYNSKHLSIETYQNVQELEEIIERFITQNTVKSKNRLNLVLGKKEEEYLEWTSYKYKRSKTDIIKQLINNEISKDKEFQKR